MLDHYLKQIPDKIEYEKYFLDNGLTVVLVPIKNIFSVNAELFIKAGAQYETKGINGISHFLEHMVFKGTKSKPSHTLLVKDIDDNGGRQNAGTGYENTSFYAHIGFEYLNYVFEFLADIFTNCIFPESEFEKEKGVVIEEIRMREDQPRSKASSLMLESLYGDQPAGWNIAGSEKNIKNMQRSQMINYYHKYYHPKNAVLFVVGNFDKISTKKLIKKYFSTNIKTQAIKFPKVKTLFDGPSVKIFNKDIKESHFVLGFNSFPEFDKNIPIISAINNILSSGFNSRLFLNIREKLGGTYYVYSDNDEMYDRGVFELSAGVNQERTEEILSAIISEIKRLKTEKVQADELNKVKNRLLSSTLMGFDNPYYASSPIYNAILYEHKVVSHCEKINNLMKVTSEDIKRISNQIFTAKNIKLGILTNGYKAQQFKKIINKI